jgi:hypothetical protein
METLAGASNARWTRTWRGSGNGSPSRWETEGFSLSRREGSFVQAGSAARSTSSVPRRTRASARSSAVRADSLKSSFAGSRTARYRVGFRNCKRELLSTMSGAGSPWACCSVSCKAVRRSGSPSARNPCFVRSQNDRRAPAARNRALSVPESERVSQLIAQTWSVGAQSQLSPFCAQTPCPYCVIFPAIHFT